MTFENACKAAIAMARQHGCTVHVNARIIGCRDKRPEGASPFIISDTEFTVSDWCDGSTVATFNAQGEMQ